VTADVAERRDEAALLVAAAGGDEQAFRSLTDPHARRLHLHCYRMLGSMDDADDALQETLLRAWQGLGRYEPRSPLAGWLHTIATNVCLTAIARRRRRPEVPVPQGGEAVWGDKLLHLQPYPDHLLGERSTASPDPEARYTQRETVQLAFITAMQLLPPRQRAVLILRDVLSWSARETAAALGDSVAAVNSALQRARASLERARNVAARSHAPSGGDERVALERFMAAWDAVDIDGIVRLLKDDALMTMPPVPAYVSGATAIGEFFATVPAGGRLDEIRLVPTSANRQPALAAYLPEPAGGVLRAYGVMVFSLDGDAISGIVGFADVALLDRFGLPRELPAEGPVPRPAPPPRIGA
jgi:RNA polymerase sigma-70 factor, ECF subfamily